MRRTALLLSLLLSGFAVVLPGTGQVPFAADFGNESAADVDSPTPVPLTPLPAATVDFDARLKLVLANHDPTGIEALYQTNSVTAADRKRELALWRPLFDQPADARVSVFFKEISAMPPAAHQFWTEYIRKLTTHDATHLVRLDTMRGTTSVFPLIEIHGRLWVVPSDKRQISPSTNPDGTKGGKRSQVPGTNGMQ
jgi:hypothetical protein